MLVEFSLIHLFCIFFYIGLFAVGGGLVAATFMQQILVERYALITPEKFYSMLAISESTPGPIGINIATYIGNELYGPVGAIVATFGEVLPAIIIIILISKFLYGFQKKPLVQNAFDALRPAASGIVLVAATNVFPIALLDLKLFSQTNDFIQLFKWKSVLFYALSTVVLFRFKKIHPVIVVLAGAIFGILFL